MPFFSRLRHSTSVERRPVGYLSAFVFFRLPRGVPRRLLSEAYQSQMQNPTLLKEVSWYFPKFAHADPEVIPRLRRDHFLPNVSQFITHQPSYLPCYAVIQSCKNTGLQSPGRINFVCCCLIFVGPAIYS